MNSEKLKKTGSYFKKKKKAFKEESPFNNDKEKSFQKRKGKPFLDSSLKEVFAKIGTPEKTPFKPDDFQLKALSAIEKYDCLVTAPTGSGKTWIAKEAIKKQLSKNKKSWYATPLKALTNNIYSHFIKEFGEEKVGILTGDRKENTNADIVVGTTEILRNQLYDAMFSGKDLSADFIVLDEAHFLGDEDRGVVWEEVLIYLPSRIPILMLSATIGNSSDIAEWLYSIRKKKCYIVDERNRTVPLHHLFYHPSGSILPLLLEENKPKLDKKVFSFLKGRDKSDNNQGLPDFGEILLNLKKFDLLPAIFFLKSRADCDAAINLAYSTILDSNPERKEKLKEKIDEFVKKYPHIANHKQKSILENCAVGAHHSGQLPIWKIVIENLMAAGLMDAIFATSTVAAGVNFPARTVFLINSDRFNGKDFISLDATQFQQMTGRAGRRGMDNVGFAVVMPRRFMNLKLVAQLTCSPPIDIESQIKINFSMVLNLLLSHSPMQIKDMLNKSFASFLLFKRGSKHKKKKIFGDDLSFLWGDFIRHFEFLKKESFVKEDGNLTSDGKWASNLRIDNPLLVAEGLRLKAFPLNNPEILAGLMACFVDDREYDEEKLDIRKIPNDLFYAFKTMRKLLSPFINKMNAAGFLTKNVQVNSAITVYNWAKGVIWEEIVKDSELAEGDIARLIIRVSDNLRHLKALKEFFPEISNSANLGIEMIMKTPASSYYD